MFCSVLFCLYFLNIYTYVYICICYTKCRRTPSFSTICPLFVHFCRNIAVNYISSLSACVILVPSLLPYLSYLILSYLISSYLIFSFLSFMFSCLVSSFLVLHAIISHFSSLSLFPFLSLPPLISEYLQLDININININIFNSISTLISISISL